MKKSFHALAPISERLANLIAGGESYFYGKEAEKVLPLLRKHYNQITTVYTAGLIRFSVRGKITK